LLKQLTKVCGPLPEGARFVSFHGKPGPEDVDDEFVKRCWI
jgi:hypothetical protein